MPTLMRLLGQMKVMYLGKEVWDVAEIEMEEVAGQDKIGRITVVGTKRYPQTKEPDRKG